jgi:hypothetical protein
VVFTLLTMRWMEWGEPIRRLYATDERQYEAIARAAPRLPSVDISAAASQRLAVHWLVGIAAEATGLGLHTTYRIAAGLLLVAVIAVCIRLVEAMTLPLGAGVIALGLVITNPYAWRLPLIAPAMVSDTVLILGTAVALLGLVEERDWVGGCVVAVLGREGGLPVAVAVCAVLVARRHRAAAVAALLVPAAAFVCLKLVGETFAQADPSAAAFTVVSPLLRLPGTARELADHFGRVVIAAPTALAVLAASLGVARRLTRSLRLALVLAGVVVLQPALFNPDWVQHNETRMAALGIVPLAFAAAAAFSLTPAARAREIVGAAVVLVAVGSLHHRYTWSSAFASPRAFVAVETAASLLLAALILWQGRRDHAIHSTA